MSDTDLAARLDALAATNAAMAAEIVALRAQLDSTSPPAPGPPAPLVGGAPMDRRRMLRTGLAAGAAAATVAVVGSASPAAAADGDPVIAGGAVDATAVTTISANLPGTGTLQVLNPGAGNGSPAAAVYAAAGNSANIGGYGGVVGDSEWQVGVSGLSKNSRGVDGHSISSYGVYATTQDGSAAGRFYVRPGGSGAAVAAVSSNGRAISAGSEFVQLYLTPRSSTGSGASAPTGDTRAHVRGEIVAGSPGTLWYCVASGTPGAWRILASEYTAGALHVLGAPTRIYDSRPGTAPGAGPKTKLTGNAPRVLQVTGAASGGLVPTGATAVSVTILLVNAANAAGNFTMWGSDSEAPASNTMVWGAGSGRYSGSTISRLRSDGTLSIAASTSTDVVLDVVGYYR